jgi:hypothetical protein
MGLKNSYIIGKSRTKEGFNLFFGKVSSDASGILSGYIEKDSHVQELRKQFEIPKKDLLLDLGTSPHPGTAYGFNLTNRYQGAKSHEFFGKICFFYKPEKEAAAALMKAFDKAQAIIERAGFNPVVNSVWEINSAESGGKWAGSYKRSKKPEQVPHRFAIKPESLPESEFVYVILHEFAHHLHAEYLTGAKINATWIKLFNTSIKLQTIGKEQSSRLLQALIEGEERPSDFKSGLSEEDGLAFNWIMRTIKADHAISIRELDCLFEADFRDEIEQLWPKKTLHKKDLKPILSEYATTNYHELIAESFAFYLTKRTLPSSITKLVERSLSFAKANRE